MPEHQRKRLTGALNVCFPPIADIRSWCDQAHGMTSRHISKRTHIADQLRTMVEPYFGRGSAVDLDARLASDLGVTGSDYLDLVSDLERTFDVDLTDFLIGSNPQYVSTGLAGWIAGEPRKPFYRDVSIREILSFLQSR